MLDEAIQDKAVRPSILDAAILNEGMRLRVSERNAEFFQFSQFHQKM